MGRLMMITPSGVPTEPLAPLGPPRAAQTNVRVCDSAESTIVRGEGRAATISHKPARRAGLVLDGVFTEFRAACEDLKKIAASRREISRVDAAADALDHAANFFTQRVAEIEQNHDYLTVEMYADLEGVTSVTVRNWIRKGELKARESTTGYLISRNAKRQRKREVV